jgi:hypothetical protein
MITPSPLTTISWRKPNSRMEAAATVSTVSSLIRGLPRIRLDLEQLA